MTTTATLGTSYVNVYVWPGDASVRTDGTGGRFGHAAVETVAANNPDAQRTYMSLWPGRSFSFKELKWKPCVCGEKISHSHNREQDEKFLGNLGRDDHYRINGLDVVVIDRVWKEYKAKGLRWSILTGMYSHEHNCAGLVLHLLEIGGLRKIVPETMRIHTFALAILSSTLASRITRVAFGTLDSYTRYRYPFTTEDWFRTLPVETPSFLGIQIHEWAQILLVVAPFFGAASALISNYAFVRLVTPGEIGIIAEVAQKKTIERFGSKKGMPQWNFLKIGLSTTAMLTGVGFEYALDRFLPARANHLLNYVGGAALTTRVVYPRLFNFTDPGFAREPSSIRVTQSNETRSVVIAILAHLIVGKAFEFLGGSVTGSVINSGNKTRIGILYTLVSMDHCSRVFKYTNVICTVISRNEAAEASNKSHLTQTKAVRNKESRSSRMKYIANCVMLFATSIVYYKCIKKYPAQMIHVFNILVSLRSIEPIAPLVYQKLRGFADSYKKTHDKAGYWFNWHGSKRNKIK